MGPFENLFINGTTSQCGGTGKCSILVSSWGEDRALFIESIDPWFIRGGGAGNGAYAGAFAFHYKDGRSEVGSSYRIVFAF